MNLVKLVSLGAALYTAKLNSTDYESVATDTVTNAKEFENYLTGADELTTVTEEPKKPAGNPFERYADIADPWKYLEELYPILKKATSTKVTSPKPKE